MDVLVIVLVTFTLCARFLDRVDTTHGGSKTQIKNIHAIYVLFLQKGLTFYYAWQLLDRVLRDKPWDEGDWEACAKAITVHIAMYLFDMTYRFDPYLTGHHLLSILALQLVYNRLQARTRGAQISAGFLVPFWVPGLALGDLSIDLSYLMHLKVIHLRDPKKQGFVQRVNAVGHLLVRLCQWTIISRILLQSWGNEDLELLDRVLMFTMPIFAWYECMDVQLVWNKAFEDKRPKERVG